MYLLSGFVLFQNTETDAETKQNLIDLIAQGGPLGIGIAAILLLLSLIAVGIFIERWLTIKSAGKVDQSFINNIRGAVAAGNIQGAMALCQSTDSPTSRMVLKGLQRIGKPLKDIDAAIENVGNLEIFKLEKNLSTLITTAIGLAIGIFSFVGYNLLVARVDKVVFQMEQTTVEFMDLLQEPS